MQKIISVILVLLVTSLAQAQDLESISTSLSALIENALNNNHELQKLKLEQEGTYATKKIVNSTFIPKIKANAIYGYGQFGISDFNLHIPIPQELQGLGAALAPALGMPENPIPPEYNTTLNLEYNDLQIFTAGINAEWVLFTGMKATHTNRALNHKALAQEELINKHSSTIVAEVIDTYDKLVLLKKSEAVLYHSEKRLNKEKERAQKALKQGLATKYDAQKIELASLELASKKLELDNNKTLLTLKLKHVCGMQEIEAIDLDDQDLTLLESVCITNRDSRPEVLALSEKEKAMDEKLKSVNSGYMPKIAAMANYQYADLDLAKVDPMAFVGLGAKWELFDGLKTSREKQLLRIEIEQQRQEREHIKSLLDLDNEMKTSEAIQAKAQLSIHEQQVEISKLALEIKSKEYQQGLCDVSAWIAAENDYQKTQLQYYQSIYEQRHAQIEILKASGNLHQNFQWIIE